MKRTWVKNDFVFAMTGYHPDHEFLKKMGVEIDKETGRPLFNEETMETNVEVFLLLVLLLQEIMQMKFLLKMAVFMERKLLLQD